MKTHRKCCVPQCPNKAKPGSKSCGRHGKRSSRATGGRAHYVHLDCRVPQMLIELEPINTTDDVTVEVRDGGTIVGLPTNRPQMIAFLRNWLNLSGHTLHLLEMLTPPMLAAQDAELAAQICRAARNLVLYDLGGAR
jgi:hypothetical protein